MTLPSAGPRPRTAHAAFAAYGLLWGPYLALLPEVRRATGADDGQLGLALLVGGLAAMPAMVVVGRLLDRLGRPVAVATMVSFALAAALPALAGSVPELVAAVAVFGFLSGACNVVVVALASTVEAERDVPVMNAAHGLFSAAVLACSLGIGAARAAGIPGRALAVALAATVGIAILVLRRRLPARLVPRARGRRGTGLGGRIRLGRLALLLSLLAGLSMAVESGVQQWSAVFAAEVLAAPVGLSAAAPGIFAGGMAFGRLAGHWVTDRLGERLVLAASGALAGAGVLLLATAGSTLTGLAAVALVGVAASVATPTAYAVIGRGAADTERGAVLGASASLAGVGLMVGPALVGQVSAHADVRLGIGVLSALSVAVLLLASLVRPPAPAQEVETADGGQVRGARGTGDEEREAA